MAIKKELYKTRTDGVNLYRFYSNANHYIRKIGTDEVYIEAIDVETASYEYEETNVEIYGGGSSGTININIENGQGTGSIQIRGGNATGENAVSLSRTMDIPCKNMEFHDENTLKVGSTVSYINLHDFLNVLAWENTSCMFKSRIDFTDGSYIDCNTPWNLNAYIGGEYHYLSSSDTEDLIFTLSEPLVISELSIEKYEFGESDSEYVSILDFVTFGYEVDGIKHNETSGKDSFSSGIGTSTQNEGEAAFGRYNKSNSNTLFSIGNGTAENPRNVLEITDDGKAIYNEKPIATEDYVNGKAATQYLSLAVGIDSSGDGIVGFCHHIIMPNPSTFSGYSVRIKPVSEIQGDYSDYISPNLEVELRSTPSSIAKHEDIYVYPFGTWSDCYESIKELNGEMFKLSYLPPDEYESVVLTSYSYYGYTGGGYYTVYY